MLPPSLKLRPYGGIEVCVLLLLLLLDLSQHVKIDLLQTSPRQIFGDLLKTCWRPGRRHVLSRFKAGFRQDRCKGIWV